MKKKVYVIAVQKSDGDWLGMDHVNTIEEADLVYFHGYTDLHPANYNLPALQQISIYTNPRLEIDNDQVNQFKKAVELKKPIVGCNRGFHLMATQAGAGLIQHMQHPMKHRITMYDDSKMSVISYHHQLVSLLRLTAVNFQLIGYATGLSPFYLNGNDTGYTAHNRDSNNNIIEPEIVHFPSIRSLGFQFNPNEFPIYSEPHRICLGLVNRLLDFKLFNGINLKIPLNTLIEKDFEFSNDNIKNLIQKEEFQNV